MPEVTVLIPAYNAAPFVDVAIRSAVRQSHGDLEVLVVDDGSADDTALRIRAWGDAVRLLSLPHGGLAWARNHGMRAALGEFVVFLDADDILEEELVASAVRCLRETPEAGFAFSNFRLMFEDGRTTPARLAPDAFGGGAEVILRDPVRQILGAGVPVSSSGLCSRREVLAEAGFFDESLWGSEDFEYWSRIYLRRPVCYLASPMVIVRRHSASMTAQAERMIPCMVAATEKIAARLRQTGRGDALPIVRAYGRRCMEFALFGMLRAGRSAEARQALWQYRRTLAGPRWPLIFAATLAPSWLLRLVARARGLWGS